MIDLQIPSPPFFFFPHCHSFSCWRSVQQMMAFGVLANASSSEDSKASAARTIKELSEQHRAQLDDMRDVCLQHKGLDILIDLLRHATTTAAQVSCPLDLELGPNPPLPPQTITRWRRRMRWRG